MFRKILVPIAITAEKAQTDRALAAAVGLSQQYQSELQVMTVLPGFGSPWVAGYFPKAEVEKIRDDVYQQLRQIVQDAVPDDLKVKLKVVDGTPYKRILDESERIGADLIVIPSHSHNAMERVLLGSVAARVVERSRVSVLVIRPH